MSHSVKKVHSSVFVSLTHLNSRFQSGLLFVSYNCIFLISHAAAVFLQRLFICAWCSVMDCLEPDVIMKLKTGGGITHFSRKCSSHTSIKNWWNKNIRMSFSHTYSPTEVWHERKCDEVHPVRTERLSYYQPLFNTFKISCVKGENLICCSKSKGTRSPPLHECTHNTRIGQDIGVTSLYGYYHVTLVHT